MAKFSPQTLAMLTYACGVLGTKSGRLMGRLMAAARPHMAEFKDHELVALVCAAARLQHTPEEAFVTRWLEVFEARVGTAEGSVLAAGGWAMASLGVRPKAAWQRAYVSALAKKVPDLKPTELSMSVWALGEWVPALDPMLVAALGKRVGECQPGFNPTVRRNMAWSLMKIRTKSKAKQLAKKADLVTKKAIMVK